MTLTITLTAEEEARLRIVAQWEGIDPAELVHQLMRAHLPPTPDENAASIALLQSWLEEDATDNLVGCQGEFDGLISLLVVRSTAFRRALGLRSKARLKPGLRTPHLHLDRALDDIQQTQEKLETFKQAINAERERAGARRIYP